MLAASALEAARLTEWLSAMVLIRTFEETADGLALHGRIGAWPVPR